MMKNFIRKLPTELIVGGNQQNLSFLEETESSKLEQRITVY